MSLVRSLRSANQGHKPVRVVDGDISQNFSVKLDARALQAADELAVRNIGHAAGGVDADNPQRAKITLLEAAPYISVRQRFLYGLLRGPVQL
jgi:hypothetical protein